MQKNDSRSSRVTMPKFGLTMAQPLSNDTVSFGSKVIVEISKDISSRAGYGPNRCSAIMVHDIAKKQQLKADKFFDKLFKNYLPENCKNPLIAYISGSAKSVDAIMDKGVSLENSGIPASSVEEILLNMTDLTRKKAVMIDGSRLSMHKLLNLILKAVRAGECYIEEVEVKRPISAKNLKGKEKYKWDYEEPSRLFQFVSDVEEATGKNVHFPEPAYTKSNYPAIHMLIRLPGEDFVIEFQITGYNVAKLKDLDDILYKFFSNKNVDPEYQPIVNILQTILLTKEEKDILKYAKIRDKLEKLKIDQGEQRLLFNRIAMEENLVKDTDSPEYQAKIKSLLKSKDIQAKDLSVLLEHAEYAINYADKEAIKALKQKADKQEKFMAYRKQAFLYQREKKVTSFAADAPEYFLPLSVDLPPEFDLNHLYKIYLECKERIRIRDGKA